MTHLHDISNLDQATLSATAIERALAASVRREVERLTGQAVVDPDTDSCLGHMMRVVETALEDGGDGFVISFADGSRLLVRAEAL